MYVMQDRLFMVLLPSSGHKQAIAIFGAVGTTVPLVALLPHVGFRVDLSPLIIINVPPCTSPTMYSGSYVASKPNMHQACIPLRTKILSINQPSELLRECLTVHEINTS